MKANSNDIEYGYGTYGVEEISRRGRSNKVTIGKFCSIAEGVVIDSGFNHNVDFISTYPFKSILNIGNICIHRKTEDIIIGNDVWIGEGAMIMSGVTIGDGAVIAARSVVTKNIPDYAIYGGVPAKLIRYRYVQSQIDNLKKIAWWNWSLDRIKENVDLLNSTNITHFINKNL